MWWDWKHWKDKNQNISMILRQWFFVIVASTKCWQSFDNWFVNGFSYSFAWCNLFAWVVAHKTMILIGENSPIVNQMLQFFRFLELSRREKLNVLYQRAWKTVHKAGVKKKQRGGCILSATENFHWFQPLCHHPICCCQIPLFTKPSCYPAISRRRCGLPSVCPPP